MSHCVAFLGLYVINCFCPCGVWELFPNSIFGALSDCAVFRRTTDHLSGLRPMVIPITEVYYN